MWRKIICTAFKDDQKYKSHISFFVFGFPSFPSKDSKEGTLTFSSEQYYQFTSVQLSGSVMSKTLWPHGLQHTRLPCPSPISWSLLKLIPIQSVMPSNHLILCCPLLLLPSIFSSIRVFPNESFICILRTTWKYYACCLIRELTY